MKYIKEFLELKIIDLENFQLTPYHLLVLIFIILAGRVLIWIVRKLFQKASTTLDKGQQYALFQIVRYVIIVVGIAIGLESVGVKITILLFGSTALLVGIGFGLQQTFNDFISGLIILFEGTIRVNDVIEVEGVIGRVEFIRLRTSAVETRDGIVIILPNSKLTSEKVINWSHNKQNTRFEIRIGVAYGSDVELVKETLLKCASEHTDVAENPISTVKFTDFGDSGLIFDLRFWSSNMFRIERVKSDLRYAIYKAFNEAGISIPFPQRDLHIKSSEVDFK